MAGVREGCRKMMGKVGGTVRVTAGHADLEGHRSRFYLDLPAEESLRLGGESDQSLSVLSALGYSCHNVVTCLYVYSTCAGPTGFVLHYPSASKGAWHTVSVQILDK